MKRRLKWRYSYEMTRNAMKKKKTIKLKKKTTGLWEGATTSNQAQRSRGAAPTKTGEWSTRGQAKIRRQMKQNRHENVGESSKEMQVSAIRFNQGDSDVQEAWHYVGDGGVERAMETEGSEEGNGEREPGVTCCVECVVCRFARRDPSNRPIL